MINPRISPEVLDFFNKLEKNNNRDWFNERKKHFKNLEADVKSFYEALFEKLKSHDEVDSFKIFRVYRDVRFSKNKDPYKTHFGGSFHRVKPRLRGGYYLQITPGDSFVAAGFWDPEKNDLLRIRKEFEADDQTLRKIINDESLKKVWGSVQGDAVKSAPKGFNKDHKAIDLIRLKQYIFTHAFTDKEVMAPGFLDNVNESFKAIRPFFDYMSEVLTTDLNGESIL